MKMKLYTLLTKLGNDNEKTIYSSISIYLYLNI